MRKVLTIAHKELRGFLASPGYYVMAAVFLLVLAFTYTSLFTHFVKSTQSGNFNPFAPQPVNLHQSVFLGHIHWVNLLFLLMIPVLMARLVAEEKKLRSFDLLMTSPISSVQIIMGKFLGAFTAVSIIILVSSIYPVSAALFTDLQWGKLLSAYGGLFLVGGIYTAVGLFCSSLTDSVVIAAIAGIIANLFLWIIAWMTVHVEKDWLVSTVEHISLGRHMDLFSQGTPETASIVFCVTLTFLFCFLAERVVESTRWRA